MYFVMNKIFREPRIYNGSVPSRCASVGYLKGAALPCNSYGASVLLRDHKIRIFK